MPQQINSTAITWRRTENDAFANGKDGTSEVNATGTMVRSEDIGQASDTAAIDTTGSRTVVQLLKGIFNLLTSLLNATTLATPNTQTLAYTFTIASSTTVTNYVKLTGRVATIFIPSSVAGTSLTVLQRRVDGTGDGFTIKTHEAIARTIVLSGDQTVDAESVGWLSGAIGSEIAFVSDTPQSSNQTIHVKVLV